ncbi:MAG: hypothetical protein Pg6A_03940 [Termitinemataceae bacterium]|nr:MAG: hypothetical protein Pg6A_03940 [Termitinemataceae bacterium]
MNSDLEFRTKLMEALKTRRSALERFELPKLKEEFGIFNTGLESLCIILVKKGLISEDPYKQDAKTSGHLQIPDSTKIPDSLRREQLGKRLSDLGKEIEYLVSCYPLSLEGCTQEAVKQMLGLVKYIDWIRFSQEAGSVSIALGEILTSLRRSSFDQFSTALINEALGKIAKAAQSIIQILDSISVFNREQYKYDLRIHGIANMSAAQAQIPVIKKNFLAVFPASPFYQLLAEEVLKEDFSPQSATLRGNVLKKLSLISEKTKNTVKPEDKRAILIEGLNAIGVSGAALGEITAKLTENHELLQNRRKGFLFRIKNFVTQIRTKEAAPVFYNLEYADPYKGVIVRERINYVQFLDELEKKVKIFSALAPRGTGEKKFPAMEEVQLHELLKRNIKDAQSFFRTLTGFDEYFKLHTYNTDRAKVRGVRPELAALKIAAKSATEKLFDYNIAVEAGSQLKKMGIKANAVASP